MDIKDNFTECPICKRWVSKGTAEDHFNEHREIEASLRRILKALDTLA
jgi:hypothetical protein